MKAFFEVQVLAASFSMGMMGANELATEYHDFGPVSGVLFPRRLTNYAGTMKLSEIVLSDIQVDRKIPGSFFIPGPPSDKRNAGVIP